MLLSAPLPFHRLLAVPASLHASLMARLDRLGVAAKEVAQIGCGHWARVLSCAAGGGGA